MTVVSLNSWDAVSSPAPRDRESALTGDGNGGAQGAGGWGAREDPVPCGLHFRGQGGEGGRELGQRMGELGRSISVPRTEGTGAGPPAPGRQACPVFPHG